jgi:hypothetical protein
MPLRVVRWTLLTRNCLLGMSRAQEDGKKAAPASQPDYMKSAAIAKTAELKQVR